MKFSWRGTQLSTGTTLPFSCLVHLSESHTFS